MQDEHQAQSVLSEQTCDTNPYELLNTYTLAQILMLGRFNNHLPLEREEIASAISSILYSYPDITGIRPVENFLEREEELQKIRIITNNSIAANIMCSGNHDHTGIFSQDVPFVAANGTLLTLVADHFPEPSEDEYRIPITESDVTRSWKALSMQYLLFRDTAQNAPQPFLKRQDYPLAVLDYIHKFDLEVYPQLCSLTGEYIHNAAITLRLTADLPIIKTDLLPENILLSYYSNLQQAFQNDLAIFNETLV